MKKVSFLMEVTVFTFILLLSVIGVYGQKESMKFGKIDMKDLKMTKYDLDTTADAVILGDQGESYFEYDDHSGFNIVFERLLRIKILKKSGYEWASRSINLFKENQNEEQLTNLKAKTYNLVNGKVVDEKLSEESIFTEVFNRNWIVKKFTMPAIKEGSVLDIAYTVKSPFYFQLKTWEFQTTIPVRWSEYEVRIPEYFHYTKHSGGYFPFTVNENNVQTATISRLVTEYTGYSADTKANFKHESLSYTEYITRLSAKDIPAMKREPYTSSLTNYLLKIEFEFASFQFPGELLQTYTTSWERINERLLKDEDFGGEIKRSGLVKDRVNSINAKASHPFDKMLLAYDEIKNTMKWNEVDWKYPTTSLRKALNEKIGNCADINLSLILLLKELGLKADPVVLSTRDNGLLSPDHPVLSKLNYVIAHVTIDSNEYLLDATDVNRPYNILPFNCLNGQGWLVSESDYRWINLLKAEKDPHLYYAEMSISPSGEVNGKLTVSESGYGGIEKRTDYTKLGSESFVKKLKENKKNWEITAIQFENITDLSQPFKIIHEMKSSEIAQVNGQMIILNVLMNEGQNDNPFKPEKRDYPVDFGCPLKDNYVFVYEIPEGYTVESVPEHLNIYLPDQAGFFRFQVTTNGNKITVNSILSISKIMFLPDEYKTLHEFMALIVEKHAQQILLKKTGS